MDKSLIYKIALSMIPGIGGVLARNLIAYTGSAEGVFSETVNTLKKIPGIGETNAARIKENTVMPKAEKEIEFILKNNIKACFYTEKEYPRRLKTCADAPIILYTKGNMNLDGQRVISIVGTRNATDYGKHACDELVHKIAERKYQVLIVSGLAYGIDIQAHKAALKYNLPTVAVIAH